MLFSQPQVAAYINENFEPVWQSVRAVPTVTIDFGNGQMMKRTMNGNIATYICNSDGYVIDVLPGIYDADHYLLNLMALKKVARSISYDSRVYPKQIHNYHSALLRATMRSGTNAAPATPPHPVLIPTRVADIKFMPGQQELLADSKINDSVRRPVIHDYLSKHEKVTPESIKNWLYREVLHADLDDPYLGLGKILERNYPFNDNG